MMKSTTTNNHDAQPCSTPGVKHSALTPEQREDQRQYDKEFIHVMNEFIAKTELLSDDPFFGGI
ncbi:hypothetical protein [Pluralibacter sp.]|uniref:hypothetical protein n=1 Tax=Pluralibacter sp. TaxID=1920032 RepID=UPI0025FA8C61|nr:hypothetical protein [Pluralibacter sp.]